MRVTTIHAAGDIRVEERPEPVITAATDAVIKITAGCICGSDLWPYRGENPITPGSTIGHEMVGVIEEVGAEVRTFRPGDFVIVPFCTCDNTCPACRARPGSPWPAVVRPPLVRADRAPCGRAGRGL